MVIVRLCGGLGNQMFQYAAGRRLADKIGSEMKLDIIWFDTNRDRPYSLQHLNIQENFASKNEVHRLKYVSPPFYDKILQRLGLRSSQFIPAPGYIREGYNRFDPQALPLSGEVYLEGYWQSEKYFSDIQTIIRNEFSLRAPLSSESMETADLISSHESVSLHVRRGDYVSNTIANHHHGVCSMEYYDRSIQYISGHVKNPHFFVFSDDPQWCGQNLHIPFHTSFIDHNGPDKGHEDIYLMSLCRHHIIANSSFSWWGAWLDPRPGKVVIAPKQWFAQEHSAARDTIPPRWITI